MRSLIRSSMLVLIIVATSQSLFAQSRTFVSARGGNDANPCSLTQPCRGFNQAVTVVAAGGDVIVLDSGGYGPAVITKGVSIICPDGLYAGVTQGSGDAIVIDAPLQVVTLHNLTVNGLGGFTGINITVAQSAHIQSCTISNFIAAAIYHPSSAFVTVTDSVMRKNGDGFITGWNGGGRAELTRCHFDKNQNGVRVGQGNPVTVRECSAFANELGYYAVSAPFFGSPGNAYLAISSSTATGNNYGVKAEVSGGGTASIDVTTSVISSSFLVGVSGGTVPTGGPPPAFIRVSDCTITNNGTGVEGGVATRLNNTLAGNSVNGVFGGGSYTPQ